VLDVTGADAVLENEAVREEMSAEILSYSV
jgi:hypothetical protein